MLSRIQINSKTDKVDVYKSLPSAQSNARYVLQIERLVLPPMSSGFIMNQPLFEVERRLVYGADEADFDDQEEMKVDMEFIPKDVKTVSQLIFQINEFFKKGIIYNLKLGLYDYDIVTDKDKLPNLAHFDADIVNPPLRDWYSLLTDPAYEYKDMMQAVVTPSGHLGIKFSALAQVLFVIKLSTEGQRIFGHQEYIAIDDNQRFKMPYRQDGAVVLQTIANLPTDAVICMLPNAIQQHLSYRHEVVITTSLPLRNVLHCEKKSALVKPQFVSYKYPGGKHHLEFDGTIFQQRLEGRKTRYEFQNARKTHNSFLLTGTDLQNFHFRLVSRNHIYNESTKVFDVIDEPYSLPPESLWTMQFTVRKI